MIKTMRKSSKETKKHSDPDIPHQNFSASSPISIGQVNSAGIRSAYFMKDICVWTNIKIKKKIFEKIQVKAWLSSLAFSDHVLFCCWKVSALLDTLVSGNRYLSLQHTDSLVVVLRLSCPGACGILVPWAGMELTSPALQGRFLTTGPSGKFLKLSSCSLFRVPIRSSDGTSLLPGQAEDKW